MNKVNNSFNLATAIIVILATFIFSWKFVIPAYKTSRASALQISAEKDAATRKLDSLNNAAKTIDDLGPVLSQMFVAIPEDQDTANVITELEAIAATYKTYIPSFQFSDDATDKTAVLISFAVNGDFDGLNSFIKAIENDAKFFKVKSFSLASKEDTSSLTIQVEAFKQSNMSLSSIGGNGE